MLKIYTEYLSDKERLIFNNVPDGLDVFTGYTELLIENLEKSKFPITYEYDTVLQKHSMFSKQEDEGFVIKHKQFSIALVPSCMGTTFIIEVLFNYAGVNMMRDGKKKEECALLISVLKDLIVKTHSEFCS